jgi:hypothetical protein
MGVQAAGLKTSLEKAEAENRQLDKELQRCLAKLGSRTPAGDRTGLL